MISKVINKRKKRKQKKQKNRKQPKRITKWRKEFSNKEVNEQKTHEMNLP